MVAKPPQVPIAKSAVAADDLQAARLKISEPASFDNETAADVNDGAPGSFGTGFGRAKERGSGEHCENEQHSSHAFRARFAYLPFRYPLTHKIQVRR
jgi:hypothetical protein